MSNTINCREIGTYFWKLVDTIPYIPEKPFETVDVTARFIDLIRRYSLYVVRNWAAHHSGLTRRGGTIKATDDYRRCDYFYMGVRRHPHDKSRFKKDHAISMAFFYDQDWSNINAFDARIYYLGGPFWRKRSWLDMDYIQLSYTKNLDSSVDVSFSECLEAYISIAKKRNGMSQGRFSIRPSSATVYYSCVTTFSRALGP